MKGPKSGIFSCSLMPNIRKLQKENDAVNVATINRMRLLEN